MRKQAFWCATKFTLLMLGAHLLEVWLGWRNEELKWWPGYNSFWVGAVTGVWIGIYGGFELGWRARENEGAIQKYADGKSAKGGDSHVAE